MKTDGRQCYGATDDEEAAMYTAQGLYMPQCLDTTAWALRKIKTGTQFEKMVSVFLAGFVMTLEEGAKRKQTLMSDPAAVRSVLELAVTCKGRCRGVTIELIRETGDKALMSELCAKLNEAYKKTGAHILSGYDIPLPPPGEGWAFTAKLDAKLIGTLAELVKTTKDANIISGVVQDCDPYRAASVLACSQNPDAVKALLALLSNPKPAVVWVASAALRDYSVNKEVAGPALVQMLNGANPTLRATVKRTLISVPYVDQVAFFTGLLASKDQDDVSSAIDAASVSQNWDYTKYLLPLLKDEKHQQEVLIALRYIEDPLATDAVIALIASGRHDIRLFRDEAVAVVAARGPDVLPKLRPLISSTRPEVVLPAVEVMERVHAAKAVEMLTMTLTNKSPVIRKAAAKALLAQADPHGITALLPLLNDKDASVRKAAALAIAWFPDEKYVTALEPLLKDKNQDVADCAGIALAQLGDAHGAQAVLNALPAQPKDTIDYEEACYRRCLIVPAVRGAGKLKEKHAIPAIFRSFGDDVSMNVFEGKDPKQMEQSLDAKVAALKSITGKDYGYSLDRWMAYWIAQGNKVDMGLQTSGKF